MQEKHPYVPSTWVGVALHAYPGGSSLEWGALCKHFGWVPEKGFALRPDLARWDVAAIVLAESCDSPDKAKCLDPKTSLKNGVLGASRSATDLLRRFPPELFEQWRALGRSVDLFVGAHSLRREVDFQAKFPAEFIAICGELRLAVEVYFDHGENAADG
jgi:hypothetical protein